MSQEPISRAISIEDLVRHYPGVVKHLIERNLPCLVCGEPAWGTLEEFARDHGYSERDIDALVCNLRDSFVQERE